MKKVLLFGGTGHLGRKIAASLQQKRHEITAVVRNKQREEVLAGIASHFIIADVTNPEQLSGICHGYDCVVSSLGKSVSPDDKSKPSFRKIDYEANSAILADAIKCGVQKFVYISAFGAEKNLHLEYFRVHHEFSEKLKASGINYTIVKPPALFSSFIDLVNMARKGRLITMGKGDKLTNPIDESDLAAICSEVMNQNNRTIEAGGKTIYSRRQINDIIQQHVNPKGKVRTVPVSMIRMGLPVIKAISKNMYDKFAFFLEVTQHDTIAPQTGKTTLEEYLERLSGKQ